MKDYRKKAVTGYNICYRQYLKTAAELVEVFLMSSFDIIDQGGEISEADGRFQICICFSQRAK